MELRVGTCREIQGGLEGKDDIHISQKKGLGDYVEVSRARFQGNLFIG
jgi:hypothetical protein